MLFPEIIAITCNRKNLTLWRQTHVIIASSHFHSSFSPSFTNDVKLASFSRHHRLPSLLFFLSSLHFFSLFLSYSPFSALYSPFFLLTTLYSLSFSLLHIQLKHTFHSPSPPPFPLPLHLLTLSLSFSLILSSLPSTPLPFHSLLSILSLSSSQTTENTHSTLFHFTFLFSSNSLHLCHSPLSLLSFSLSLSLSFSLFPLLPHSGIHSIHTIFPSSSH